MIWKVEFTPAADKHFARLDRAWQRRIIAYMEKEIAHLDDPRVRGKPLTGELRGLWRYRIGDYRAICRITESTVTILVIQIGHRSDVYR